MLLNFFVYVLTTLFSIAGLVYVTHQFKLFEAKLRCMG